MSLSTLTVDHLNALNRFAKSYGRSWRSKLHAHWLSDSAINASPADAALLRQVRNNYLDTPLIQTFKPRETDWNRVLYLTTGQQERFTLKRAWMVQGFRIVDEEDVDQVQPWFASRPAAREFAISKGYYLIDKLTS